MDRERLKSMKICSLHKFIKRFNNIPIKIPIGIVKEFKLNLKFIWKNEVAKNRQDIPEKNVRGLALPDIKICTELQ